MCLNVSIIDGLDILLFINRGDIFAKSILVLWSLIVTAMTLKCLSRLNVSCLFNAATWAPKIK